MSVRRVGLSIRYCHRDVRVRTYEFRVVPYADDVCVVPDVEPGSQAGDEGRGPTRELSVGVSRAIDGANKGQRTNGIGEQQDPRESIPVESRPMLNELSPATPS